MEKWINAIGISIVSAIIGSFLFWLGREFGMLAEQEKSLSQDQYERLDSHWRSTCIDVLLLQESVRDIFEQLSKKDKKK